MTTKLFFKNNKRAQIEMQFNWVFILIVGVVILGFFFTIISNQNKKANVENAQDLIETLDSVFNTIYVNPNTVNTFHISKARLDFACEEGLSEYYIQGTGPVDTSKDIIFTPYTLRGNTIITWTQEWNVPFEAGVFTYMANDMTAFVFVNDSANIWELYQEMPDAFQKTIVDETDYAEDIGLIKGYDRIVIIHSSTISGITIGGDSGIYERELSVSDIDQLTGTIIFDAGSTEKSRGYYTREMLWGAIFTDDEISYDCTVNKATSKMRFVAEVLRERDEALSNELLYTNCYNYLTGAVGDLETIITGSETWKTTWSGVANAREQLEDDQELLLRGYRCPNIY